MPRDSGKDEEVATRKLLELQSEVMNGLVRSGMSVADAVRTVIGAAYNCFFDSVLLSRKLSGESLDLDWKRALSDPTSHEATAHGMVSVLVSRLQSMSSKWRWTAAIVKRQRGLGEK